MSNSTANIIYCIGLLFIIIWAVGFLGSNLTGSIYILLYSSIICFIISIFKANLFKNIKIKNYSEKNIYANKIVKEAVKKPLKIDSSFRLKPLLNLVHIGSYFQDYHVPGNFLNDSSICYCVDAGEDITFDTELAVRYGCKVFHFLILCLKEKIITTC